MGTARSATTCSRLYDPSYNSGLAQRAHDPEQAKSLLKSAGVEGLNIDLVTSDIAQGSTAMATVFAQQAKDAGVTVNLKKVTVSDFYGPQYLKWVFAQDFSFFQYYLPSVAQFFVPSGPYNETHYDNPQYTSLFDKALKTVDESERTDIVHQMQQIDYDDGGYIIPLFPPVIDGVASTVHGVAPTRPARRSTTTTGARSGSASASAAAASCSRRRRADRRGQRVEGLPAHARRARRRRRRRRGPGLDRRAKTRRELVARRPATRAVADDDDVLSSDADLIVITTAPATHAALTRQALEAGKHVVVEKPFASNPDEGRELAEPARARELLLAVAPFVQLSPAFAMLGAWVRGGALGRIDSARAMYGNPGSTWASWYHTSGVGPLGDIAIYNPSR